MPILLSFESTENKAVVTLEASLSPLCCYYLSLFPFFFHTPFWVISAQIKKTPFHSKRRSNQKKYVCLKSLVPQMLLDFKFDYPRLWSWRNWGKYRVVPQIGHRFPIHARLAKLLEELLNDVFVSRSICWYILPFNFELAYPFLGHMVLYNIWSISHAASHHLRFLVY